MNKIRRGKFVPLIVMLMLICVIPTIMLVVGATIGRPQETAELNKEVEQQEEQISAATTTVNAGDTYTVPKTGLYKIELHGGKSNGFIGVSGLNGSKITGVVSLSVGDRLTAVSLAGGNGFSTLGENVFGSGDYGRAGSSLDVDLNR
ncbi:MAG: hypothetical protein HFJ19_04080 [Clostridia bacterium]|nr:hypothetical protein [Clostridia bacterium]